MTPPLPGDQDSPLVSVIITTYNRPGSLRRAVASALAQRYGSIELIVSDDAGTADLEPILASFQDSRIHYRRNATNLGVVRNTRAAVAAARGTLISFLNDDDQWTPEFLSTLVPILVADPEVAIAFSDHWIIDETSAYQPSATDDNSSRWRRDQLRPGIHRPFHRVALVHQSVPIAMSAVLRVESVEWEDMPDEIGPAYDLWLSYLACRGGAAAHYSRRRLTGYRVHAGMQSKVASLRLSEATTYCIARFLADPRLSDIRSELEGRHAFEHMKWALRLARVGRLEEATGHLMLAWRHPLRSRAVAARLISGRLRVFALSRMRRLAGGDVRGGSRIAEHHG